ncbi:MAG: phosphoribosylamine--glycine ligase [Candidatus Gottesmanbacteria bacterium]|nr:phosphoribosylamine--glycine ligase [Candidatus Gottesmanbacteria bacterium]
MTERILVVGGGGREHAIGWKLAHETVGRKLYFAPGNGGTCVIGTNIDVGVTDVSGLVQFASDKRIDLTVVGPEAPLESGIVDTFAEEHLPIFGPTRSAAMLETDKAFAVRFMEAHGIPHPDSVTFTDFDKAKTYMFRKGVRHIVIKAAGLAGGKGVFLPDDEPEAIKILGGLMTHHTLGTAGERVIIQERLTGPEISMLAFSDGTRVIPLLPAQDHKRLNDGDEGPMTGGVGAVADVPFVTHEMIDQMYRTILQPTVDGMREEGHPYTGILYAGLMMTKEGPKVLEYNARFGDPETQPLMMLMNTQLAPVLLSCIEGTLTESQVGFTRGKAACVVLASEGYPESPVLGREIFGLDTVNDPHITVFHAGTMVDDGKLLTHGGRVLGVTAWGKTLSDALAHAYGAIGEKGIHFDGMQYRKDIGRTAQKTILVWLPV